MNAQNHACVATIRSGDRRGMACGRPADFPHVRDAWYCKRHRVQSNVLCEYDPGIPLHDAASAVSTLAPDIYGESNVGELRGYINVRVRVGDETVPLVLMSRISPGEEAFTKATLAIELAKCVEYIASRPDVYDVGGVRFEDLVLNEIKYDCSRGIFVANLSDAMRE